MFRSFSDFRADDKNCQAFECEITISTPNSSCNLSIGKSGSPMFTSWHSYALVNTASKPYFYLFIYLFSLIADGPHHYHPACGHKGSSHISPVHSLQFFYRDARSALLQLVNQRLSFTYSRSHAFRHERKNTNPTKVRIELTTSALAGMQVTH